MTLHIAPFDVPRPDPFAEKNGRSLSNDAKIRWRKNRRKNRPSGRPNSYRSAVVHIGRLAFDDDDADHCGGERFLAGAFRPAAVPRRGVACSRFFTALFGGRQPRGGAGGRLRGGDAQRDRSKMRPPFP